MNDGDMVCVNYTGCLADGTVFDTSDETTAKQQGIYNPSRDYEPLCFTLGAGEMIPGFERGVLGLEEGESKKITVPPEEGYGPLRDDLIIQVPVENLRKGAEPQVGDRVSVPSGHVGVIVKIEEGQATIDFNHPLAGETLYFDVQVVSIQSVEG